MAKTRFTTPTMRFVQGDVDTAQDKDQQGNLRVIKSGPNAGQPNPQYFVAGAIHKADPLWPAFWAQMVTQAVADFPNLFPYGAQPLIDAGGPVAALWSPPAGQTQAFIMHREFSFKITDGDGFDNTGKSNATKEGFAGHWVVRFSSAYKPRCFHVGRYAPQDQIQTAGAIKRGWFIRVNGAMEGNGQASKPGLYMNLDLVELAGTGPEIVTGPSAADAFGGAAPALPAGASPLPLAPAVVGAAAIPSPAAALPVAASPVPPVAAPAVPPYAGFMPPAPPAPVAVVPSPPVTLASAPVAMASPSSGPVMTAAAGGATYDQMIAAGWTDETLRANGMMQ